MTSCEKIYLLTLLTFANERNNNLTHNFFVDDFKLYASNINILKKQLDLVTTYLKDTGMTFGEDKCAFQQVENGKLIKNTIRLEINNLSIEPIKDGDTYKYLGIDENISYVGTVNKKKVTKEYYMRVKKIWKSELSSFNKVIAHNSFAIPIIANTVGIIDWTIDEIKEIDIKTRKHITMTGNFHPNGDIDKLYLPRVQGGRGLKMVARMFESRVITIGQYLTQRSHHNEISKFIYETELPNMIRLQHNLLATYNIYHDISSIPKKLSKQYMNADLAAQKERYLSKVMHGFYERKIQNDIQIDKQLSYVWRKEKYVSSEIENYHSTIQDQELSTKHLKNKRAVDNRKTPDCNNKCRLCTTNVEDISHIIAGCSHMSTRYYLPLRHDEVAKTVLNTHIKKYNLASEVKLSADPEYIYKEEHREYWWNVSIKNRNKSSS